MDMKKAAICFQAKAGDEDGRLLAGGVSARWIRGDAFNPEGNAQDLPEVQGTIGASENWSSKPSAAWRGAKQDDGTYNEGNDVLDALNKGMKVSGKWYQPSASKSYINAPRYSAGDVIQSYAGGLEAEEESWNKLTPCMKATLAGASNLIAGAAIAFGAVALM